MQTINKQWLLGSGNFANYTLSPWHHASVYVTSLCVVAGVYLGLDVSCVPVLGQGLVQLAPVVLLADGQQHGDHGEAADRQHVAEPGRAHARDVEEAQEDHRDQVVPDVEPAPDHPL